MVASRGKAYERLILVFVRLVSVALGMIKVEIVLYLLQISVAYSRIVRIDFDRSTICIYINLARRLVVGC